MHYDGDSLRRKWNINAEIQSKMTLLGMLLGNSWQAARATGRPRGEEIPRTRGEVVERSQSTYPLGQGDRWCRYPAGANLSAMTCEDRINFLLIGAPLAEVRAEAARVHEEWRQASERLKPQLDQVNARGEAPSAALQAQLDQYNRLVQIDSGLQHRLAKLEQQEAERLKFAAQASITSEHEERAFWFRRFHTSLAIAHGAAFAAIGSHLFDKDVRVAVVAAAWSPMALFAAGMVIAGMLPLALHRRDERLGWRLASISAVLFVVGLAAALLGLWRLAGLVFPWPP